MRRSPENRDFERETLAETLPMTLLEKYLKEEIEWINVHNAKEQKKWMDLFTQYVDDKKMSEELYKSFLNERYRKILSLKGAFFLLDFEHEWKSVLSEEERKQRKNKYIEIQREESIDNFFKVDLELEHEIKLRILPILNEEEFYEVIEHKVDWKHILTEAERSMFKKKYEAVKDNIYLSNILVLELHEYINKKYSIE